jgi:hypothetical protein
MNIQDLLNGIEDPWDRLNRLETTINTIGHQHAQEIANGLRHIAGISQNQSNLIMMYDDLNNKINNLSKQIAALQTVFNDKA